ncbi:hypothetical protein ACI3PL_32415, partial [Lacticaseibacillus paracasei]
MSFIDQKDHAVRTFPARTQMIQQRKTQLPFFHAAIRELEFEENALQQRTSRTKSRPGQEDDMESLGEFLS